MAKLLFIVKMVGICIRGMFFVKNLVFIFCLLKEVSLCWLIFRVNIWFLVLMVVEFFIRLVVIFLVVLLRFIILLNLMVVMIKNILMVNMYSVLYLVLIINGLFG